MYARASGVACGTLLLICPFVNYVDQLYNI